jgi:hypothetical protein
MQPHASENPREAAQVWANACHAQLNEAEGDMRRLETLITQTAQTLFASFQTLEQRWKDRGTADGAMLVDEEVGRAVTALQFEDLATQLLGHARKRIAVAGEGLRKLTVLPPSGPAGEWGTPPELAAPVGHANLETGSVELF